MVDRAMETGNYATPAGILIWIRSVCHALPVLTLCLSGSLLSETFRPNRPRPGFRIRSIRITFYFPNVLVGTKEPGNAIDKG